MDTKNKIKFCHTIFGLPLLPMVIGFCLSVALNFELVGFVLSVFWSFLYKKHYLKSYTLKLEYNFDLPFHGNILVNGFPLDFAEQVNTIVDENKLVIIHCPKDKLLRSAIKQSIYRLAGFVEFVDSNEFKLEETPLDERVFVLSCKTKEHLQDAMAALLKRGGWSIHGGQGFESSLIDRVYTQTMVFSPCL